MMMLSELLLQKRSKILDGWFEYLVVAYPEDSARFIRKHKNVFGNPIGSSLREGLDGLFDQLVEALKSSDPGRVPDPEILARNLDRIIRVLAVQNFAPSHSLAFILRLKTVVRQTLAKELTQQDYSRDMEALEAVMEMFLLAAMDGYAASRERLAEIRINDEKRRMHMLLRRARLICETPEEPVELPDFRDGGQ